MIEKSDATIEGALSYLLDALFPTDESIVPTHIISTETRSEVLTRTRVGIFSSKYIALTVDTERKIVGYCVVPSEEFPFIETDNRSSFRNQRGVAYMMKNQSALKITFTEIPSNKQH